MKNNILFLILLLFANVALGGKPKIVASITPIASIVSMLVDGAAEVVAIDISAGCPHHYQMYPSDKDKIAHSQMLIFIDDSFEGFAGKIFSRFQDKTVKISELHSINFLDTNGQKNWHFWLDLKNVLALQEELSNILLKYFPELKDTILSNKNKAQAKITSLAKLKQRELTSVNELVILSDSLEHFFAGMDAKIIKLYQRANSSLRDFKNLERILNTDRPQCIVIDNTQDPNIYKKFNKKIIQVESENWTVAVNISQNLFYTKYLEMMNQFKDCQ